MAYEQKIYAHMYTQWTFTRQNCLLLS